MVSDSNEYNESKKQKPGDVMKRVIGFALFFIAVGIILGMFLPSDFCRVLICILCFTVGYQMFTC